MFRQDFLSFVRLPMLAFLTFASPITKSYAYYEENSLEQEIKAAAESMVLLLTSKEFKSIKIVPFEGPKGYPASAGSGIAEILITHFRKNGIQVLGLDRNADVTVSGKYVFKEIPGGPTSYALAEFVVSMVLKDRIGTQKEFLAKSTDGKGISGISGIPIVVPPPNNETKSPSDRMGQTHAVLLESITHPVPHIVPPDKAQRSGSPYYVQAIASEKALPLRAQDGFVYCDLRRDQEFEIQIGNESEFDAAVVVRLDGINSFHFSEMRLKEDTSKSLYEYYIVPAKKIVRVKGWHIDNQTGAQAFKITGFEGSAASHAYSNTDAIGTISVSFSLAWEGAIPDELKAMFTANPQGDFVGFGDIKNFKVQAVPRTIGELKEVIAIRYGR